jgi:hypothetical protein
VRSPIENGVADAGQIALQVGDRPRLPAVDDFEIARGEVLNEVPLLIAHDGRNPHHIDARFE